MDEPTNKDTPAFNAGVSLLIQLDAIERAMVEAKTRKPIDYSDYFNTIDAYFMTLIGELNDKEALEQLEIRKKIVADLKDIITKKNSNLPIPSILVESIHNWQIELRRIKTKVLNMGMPRMDDDRNTPILSRKPKLNYR